MPSPVLVRRAVFLGAVVLGASFTARATPPCPTSEELLFAVDVARIDEIEAEVKHDVIAFLTSVAEHVGDEARFMHQGMTSSDVLDTCLAVQLARATDILLEDLDKLLAVGRKGSRSADSFHRELADHLRLGLPMSVTAAQSRRVLSVMEAASASAEDCGRPAVPR